MDHPQKPGRRLAGKRLRRWIALRLLTGAFGCTLAVILAEISLRAIGVGYPQLYTPDVHCGTRLRPNTSGVWTTEGHGSVSVNSIGFRGVELPPTSPGRIRIAVLGDSFIEGLQVDSSETFCSQLEGKLNRDVIESGKSFEVINCGVSGYGTAQSLQMLRHYVLELEPAIVLLAVFPQNDIRNNYRPLEGDASRPYFDLDAAGTLTLDTSFRTSESFVVASSKYEQYKAFVVNCSRVLQLLKHLKNNYNASSRVESVATIRETLAQTVESNTYVFRDDGAPNHQQAWQVTERLIEQIGRDCSNAGIKCGVFTVSCPVQVYPDLGLRSEIANRYDLPDLFYSEHRLQRVSEDSDITFFTLASHLQRAADSTGRFYHGFPNTILGDGHWNAEGNATAATIVAEWLQKSLLPIRSR